MGIDIDVALVLVLATAVAGVIWLVDTLFLARARRAGDGEPAAQEPVVVEYARSFFPVLLVVLLLRSFIVEPFRIPSSSMMPTLLVGDFILVNKFSYGVRWPVLNTKIFDTGEPQRGDVVVFRYPRQPELDYIKRIIGLPGDHIAYYEKTLYVNGEKEVRQPKGPYESPSGHHNGAQVFVEKLGDVEHDILVTPAKFGLEGEYVVPEGHYFVMGDNRDNSNDGRYWGYVPEDHLVGKAFVVWMNWDWSSDGEGIIWSRWGSIIN